MPTLSYRQPGLVLRRNSTAATPAQVRELQRDLRRLGYLRRGIDGGFGPQTELAVKGLQHDLLHNTGGGSDGAADAPMTDFNKGRVSGVTGQADQNLVECISDLLDDVRLAALPSAENPREENQKIVAQIAALPTTDVPVLFLMAILMVESNLKHFNEPGTGDDDTFITVGLDRNVPNRPDIITSRGYGAGQFTLFHHPPTRAEVDDIMLDVGRNVEKAGEELKGKFDRFVIGRTAGTRADDRIAEAGRGPLRVCKFKPSEAGFLRDCKQCLLDAGKTDIVANVTPVFAGSPLLFANTPLHDMNRDAATYRNVPVRANIPCDWPYAVRRYNGAGLASYHYQVRVLQNLRTL